ncbi:MAG: response regulator [Gammaproteobacteria bacterium]|nr:response regulator [Gammaproteobacteria bacterium]
MTERTLLLVDDEENILAALTRLLRRDGYRILSATGGAAGLALLAQHEVGVIISDQRMPEMSGVEFLSQVKERHPDTVRIVLSGYTDLNSVTDAINRGAVYKFLTKPWDDELLRKNVGEAFHRFELKKENARLTEELRQANERLSAVNQGLQHQVAEESGKAQRRLTVLQMEQEILDNLPLGVIGVDDQGMLVVANQAAQQLLGQHGPLLIGDLAQDVLPAPLLDCLARPPGDGAAGCTLQTGSTALQVLRSRIGRSSQGHGTVLMLVPQEHR